MFSKIQRKLLGIKYNVDVCEQSGTMLTISGWLCSEKCKINKVHFLIEDKRGNKFNIKGKYGILRNDVYQDLKIENAKKSGYYVQAIVENIKEYEVWIVFLHESKKYRIHLGSVVNEDDKESKADVRVTEIDANEKVLNIVEKIQEQKQYCFEFPEQFYSNEVDIIIPVYNGYKFLEKLLSSVTRTKMKYRLILINDKSPDERVLEYLEKYAKGKSNVLLLNNEENKGFVQTVNRGFGVGTNHVALVNTDVELPDMWLERLMLPIFEDEKVASTTPYTTCGTICSFPDFGKDNKLFLDLNVDQIDAEFIKQRPVYTEMPTGVGFCIGVNRNVLNEIGNFDAKTFGKGYGEENDWCQRAIEKGYKNVHVENLFVFHNHGGSFLSEDKKKFLKEHEKKLLEKHPAYNSEVAKFCVQDPNKSIRQSVEMDLLCKYSSGKTILAFDHMLGGGATKYLENKKKQCLDEGDSFVIIRYDYLKNLYKINYYWKNDELKLQYKDPKDLPKVIEYLCVDEIWINELVTYPVLYDHLRYIRETAQKNEIPVKMLFHDFFAVCPTINLLDNDDNYCAVPDCMTCNKCLKENKSLQALDYGTMEQWRDEWKTFLQSCKEVVVFSDSTKEIAEHTFGKLENISVIPHQIGYMPQIKKENKTTKTLNIGLLGVLTKHKGGTIVAELAEKIERENLDVRIKLIGTSCVDINSPVFSQTGAYTRGAIPRLTLENDIDVFLIPSIWPETFSYTTEEIMKMGMPIMCFDIGAPAERVKKYDKGIIIPAISAESVYQTIRDNQIVKESTDKIVNSQKVLFVVQEVTFSSRYRIDHLREQLIRKGISSDCVSIKDTKKCDLKIYSSVVVYRISEYEKLKKLKSKAKKLNMQVFYDIDDYIFNYQAIKDIGFLKGKEYRNYENYTEQIRNCMEICDGYIVSTLSLEKVIKEQFPGKVVVVNRNVASMEMVIASLTVEKVHKDNITIGYFSGTKTHNDDFESIKDELLSVMQENENIHLLVAGQIELPAEFNAVKDQVETFKFVSWQELPHLIAKADINLMPLENSIFHECKSENKWMEAALVNVPTIASRNSELASVIRDGEDGFLCKNSEEWAEKLNKLVEDENLRNQMSFSAHERVMKEYMTDDIESEVWDIILK